jgi:hypothetical protein
VGSGSFSQRRGELVTNTVNPKEKRRAGLIKIGKPLFSFNAIAVRMCGFVESSQRRFGVRTIPAEGLVWVGMGPAG